MTAKQQGVCNEVCLYRITADYRKDNPHKPDYYVLAKSAKEAKHRVRSRITWLHIYGCEIVGDKEAGHIVENPMHYIVF